MIAKSHYVPLDSLRGLAACSVVLCHATNVLPGVYDNPRQLWWITQTPLATFWAGHAAVVFFFVLSGFVLALPFLKGSVAPAAFLFRRICRIWIPYVVAMVVAVACALWFHPAPVAGLSQWANHPLGFPSWPLILNHLLLIGTFLNGTYDPVIWSLVYEMRISLIFPLLVLLLRLGSWWRVLGAATALSMAELLAERLPFWAGAEDLPMTLHYAGLFVLGMLLARDLPRLTTGLAALSRSSRMLLWLLALMAYGHAAWLFPNARWQHVPLYRDGLTAAGVSVFILFALSPASWFSAWLQGRWLVFLGKISYSVYLYHAIILLSLVHLYYGHVPLALLWLATGVLTLGVATLAYHLIEVPSIWLGKQVRLNREPPALEPTHVGLPFVGKMDPLASTAGARSLD